MKIRHIFLGLLLIFTFWFVLVMVQNQEDFHYFANSNFLSYDEKNNYDIKVHFSEKEMYESMKINYPVHYFLLKNQIIVFLLIVLFCTPYKRILQYLWKSREKV